MRDFGATSKWNMNACAGGTLKCVYTSRWWWLYTLRTSTAVREREKERAKGIELNYWWTDGGANGRMDTVDKAPIWRTMTFKALSIGWRAVLSSSAWNLKQQEFSLGQTRRTSIKSKKRFPPLLMALLYCYYVCCFVIVADDDHHHRHHQSAED